MKTVILICLNLTIRSFFQVSIAQPYQVPGAQMQPAWVFPLWFEDGNGNRDTLYFSYDPQADILGDTVFGSIPEYIDTSKFQAYYQCALTSDLYAKKKVTLSTPTLQLPICFIKAQMPLILRWDSILFYNDTLPFPDKNPAPRAQGILYFDLPMSVTGCSFETPLLLTDTVLPISEGCNFTDSILFEGNNASYLNIKIDEWTGTISGINPTQINFQNILVYPNPTSGIVHVDLNNNHKSEISIKIYNVYGKFIREFVIDDNYNVFTTYDLTAGVYILVIRSKEIKTSVFQLIVNR